MGESLFVLCNHICQDLLHTRGHLIQGRQPYTQEKKSHKSFTVISDPALTYENWISLVESVEQFWLLLIYTAQIFHSTNIPHSYMEIYVKLGNTCHNAAEVTHSRDMSMSTVQKHVKTTHRKTEVLCCPLLTQCLLSFSLFDIEIKEAMLWPLISFKNYYC